ncbi:zf-HC2 domain-containing protein [Polynucleobacter sp.]
MSQLRDNELDVEDVARLARHLQSCSRCQTARQQFECLHRGLDVLLAID